MKIYFLWMPLRKWKIFRRTWGILRILRIRILYYDDNDDNDDNDDDGNNIISTIQRDKISLCGGTQVVGGGPVGTCETSRGLLLQLLCVVTFWHGQVPCNFKAVEKFQQKKMLEYIQRMKFNHKAK